VSNVQEGDLHVGDLRVHEEHRPEWAVASTSNSDPHHGPSTNREPVSCANPTERETLTTTHMQCKIAVERCVE
jgi:hypothetical protein